VHTSRVINTEGRGRSGPEQAIARAFWDSLNELRRRRRHMSYRRLGKESGTDYRTLHYWLTARTSLASWEEIQPIVAALDGEQDRWLVRWRQAGATRVGVAQGHPEAAASKGPSRHATVDVATSVWDPTLVAAELPGLAGLPRDTAEFTGRAEELALLRGLPNRAGRNTQGAAVICAVDGMAGVGKTALAVHAAHRLAGRFPDGCLFIDLYGYAEGSLRSGPARHSTGSCRPWACPASEFLSTLTIRRRSTANA